MGISKNKLNLTLFALLILSSCTGEKQHISIASCKEEILETEKNFADMAESKGIPEAFLFFAAEDAVLMRNNKLVIGRKKLQEYFGQQSSSGQEVHLTWKPDFVDVSSSGDLGYTYGNYIFSYADSTGVVREDAGVFHTVWKRQKDGNWKFVWD